MAKTPMIFNKCVVMLHCRSALTKGSNVSNVVTNSYHGLFFSSDHLFAPKSNDFAPNRSHQFYYVFAPNFTTFSHQFYYVFAPNFSPAYLVFAAKGNGFAPKSNGFAPNTLAVGGRTNIFPVYRQGISS